MFGVLCLVDKGIMNNGYVLVVHGPAGGLFGGFPEFFELPEFQAFPAFLMLDHRDFVHITAKL